MYYILLLLLLLKNIKNNEKTKCSPRGERGAVAKAKPQELLVN